MKKIALSMALLLAPVMAQASDLPSKTSAPKMPAKQAVKFDGYVGGDIGYQTTTTGFSVEGTEVYSFDSSGMSYGVHGSFAAMLADQYGVQVDADFRRTSHEVEDCESDCTLNSNSPSLAGHLFWRDSSKGLVGAFAQYTNATKLLGGVSGTEHTLFGLEGQYFLNSLTFYAQVAYVDAQMTEDLGGSLEGDGFALTGQVRYFANPDLMLAVRASYIDTDWAIEGTDISNNKTTSVGGRVEYRISNNPVSLYGDVSYSMSEIDFSDVAPLEYSMDETRFMLGLNLNFGGSTLFERDRSGASLNIVDAPHSPVTEGFLR